MAGPAQAAGAAAGHYQPPAAPQHAARCLPVSPPVLSAARIAEQAPEPFDKEVTMCDQLAAYLKKFVVAEEVGWSTCC